MSRGWSLLGGFFLVGTLSAEALIRSPKPPKLPLMEALAAHSLSESYVEKNVSLGKKDKTWQWNGRNSIGAPSQSFASPLPVGDGRVLLGVLGAGLQLRDLKTGALIWSLAIPLGVGAEPWLSEPFVYAAGMDAKARKIRLSTGEEIWKSTLSVESTGGVVVSRGAVYVTTADDSLWALDDGSGKPLWRYKRPSPTGSVYWSLRGAARPLISADGTRVFVGFSDGAFVALDAESGRVKWERNFGNRKGRFQDADLSPILGPNGRSVVLSLVDGDLIALSPENGDSLWSLALKCASSPVISNDGSRIFQASTDGHVYAIAPIEGRVEWKVKVSAAGSPATLGLLPEGKIAASLSGNGFKILETSDGKTLWEDASFWNSASAPVADGNRVMFMSARNQLLVYQLNTAESRKN